MAEKEIKYLTDTFDNVRFTGGYCMATNEGSEGRLNDILDTFLHLSSTSFIQAEQHIKDKNHKHYSQKGKCSICGRLTTCISITLTAVY